MFTRRFAPVSPTKTREIRTFSFTNSAACGSSSSTSNTHSYRAGQCALLFRIVTCSRFVVSFNTEPKSISSRENFKFGNAIDASIATRSKCGLSSYTIVMSFVTE